jgi:hypothetical protein
MRRWLLNEDDTPREGSFAIAADKELYCTRTGQVLDDLKGKSVFHLNAELAKELADKREQNKLPRTELLQEVRKLITVPTSIKPGPVQEVGKLKRDGMTIRKLVFETEPGIKVPALHFVPTQAKKAAALIIYVHEEGMAKEAGVGGAIEDLVRKGDEVLALDPRGLGETAPGKFAATSNFGPNFKSTFLSLHLSRPLLGQRVLDVLAVIEAVAAKAKDRPIHVIGVGLAGPIALHVAALDERVTHLTLERSIPSWSAVVHTPVNYNQLENVVPGALALYDLPDLVESLAPRTVFVRSPFTPDIHQVMQ